MSDEQGFTLVEVLVAATLLIMGVFATLALIDKRDPDDGGEQAARRRQRRGSGDDRACGGWPLHEHDQRPDGRRPATPAAPGPADRMRLAMDPDGDQGSSAITPATVTSGTLPLNTPQSWSLRRKNTTYTVSYRACTASDPYQGVVILGPFDCTRTGPDPTTPAAATRRRPPPAAASGSSRPRRSTPQPRRAHGEAGRCSASPA